MEGAELKQRREAVGYSQGDMAALLGVHTMTLSKWEREVLPVPLYIELALRTIEREKRPQKK